METTPAVSHLMERVASGSPLSRHPHRPLQSMVRRPFALAAFTVLGGWIALGLLAPHLPLIDPNEVIIQQKLQAPTWQHLFGTDEVGRDVFSRVIYAGRISLPSAILIVVLSVIIGCAIGAFAARRGGTIDQVIMRVCDAVLSMPSLILAMVVATIRGGPGLVNVIVAVILVLWPEYARLMRGEVLRLQNNDYVLASRATGATSWHTLWHHIMPGSSAAMLVKATLDVGSVILLTASLSFLGFGALPPAAEWGAMISQGARVGLQFWWTSTFPAIAIISSVIALNFLGDSIRDALDPRR